MLGDSTTTINNNNAASAIGTTLANFVNGMSAGSNDWISTLINPNYEANKINEKVANENLQLQKDIFEYNKDLQAHKEAREDNAYQRTVQDMRAAGISPLTLTGGTNNAGEAIAQNAPQKQYQELPNQTMSTIFNLINSAAGISNVYLQAEKQKAEIAKIMSETQAIEDNTSFNKETAKFRKAITEAEAMLKAYEMSSEEHKKEFREAFGIEPGASKEEMILGIAKALTKGISSSTFNIDENGNWNENKKKVTAPGITEMAENMLDTLNAPQPIKKGLEKILNGSIVEGTTIAPNKKNTTNEQKKGEISKFRKWWNKWTHIQTLNAGM